MTVEEADRIRIGRAIVGANTYMTLATAMRRARHGHHYRDLILACCQHSAARALPRLSVGTAAPRAA